MDPQFVKEIFEAHRNCSVCPSPKQIAKFFDDILGTLFPDFSKKAFSNETDVYTHLNKLKAELYQLIIRNPQCPEGEAEQTVDQFFGSLGRIRGQLSQDIAALYEGDPAAKSKAEVTRSYLGFYATAAYRIAHRLLELSVPIIPRIITEYAHSKTGIDIHPGAKIGEHLFIDHGTGIVIGETAIIGDHVKFYQGVTVGALSIKKEDAGTKRHPTIEDHVILYAGATILGGETVIGHHSIIGGNVWLTKSVPPHSKVYYQAKMTNGVSGETDILIIK